MKNAIYIIIFLANLFFLTSQEAVISEYYNDTDYAKEWTEILVTKDFLNLSHYKLRDNSDKYNEGGFWQGGVEFNDNSLWKNLRIGTVIVINHRGTSAPDIDPSDGYIEVDAENPTYFNKYNWKPISSLSISQNGDILQLLNPSGENVHSLAHVQYSTQGDFVNIVGRKIGYVGNCSIGYSISVGNARKLEDYNLNIANQGGFDTGKSITLHSPSGTKGKANKNPKGSSINYQFWQELRQPTFNKVFLKVKKIDSIVTLNWNTINPIPNTNDYGGYIILKSTDLKNTTCKPLDGKEYNVGQKVCDQTYVLAIIKGSKINSFIDENPFCGTITRYSVFAFSFGYDKNTDWGIEDGRGVAYSDDLNESNYEDLILDESFDLSIYSRLGTKFCSMDTTVLFTNISDENKEKYKYAWYYRRDIGGAETIVVDYTDFGIADSIKIYRPGYYRLEIKDETGCITKSDTLFIEIIDQPEAIITDEFGKEFKKDTIIQYCGDLNYKIKSKSPFDDLKLITTLKNGNKTENNSGEVYTVTQPGNYYYISNLEGCVDTSAVVTFEKIPYDITSNIKSLDLNLTITQPSKIDSIVLYNNTNVDYKFNANDIKIKNPFKILNPYPIIVPANSNKTILIEFAPAIDGKYKDTLHILGLCDSELKIALNGLKLKSKAALIINLTNTDFGNLIQCTYNEVDTVVTITNIGDEFIVMKELNGIGDFYANPTINNDTLLPNEKFNVSIGSTSKKLGQLIGNFNIPWKSENGLIDTLRFYAKAFIDTPRFEILEDTLDFGQLSGCEDYLIDSVTFINKGLFELKLDDADFVKGLTIVNKPIIVPPGDTVVVYLKYSSNSPGKINQKNNFKVIPGCGYQDNFFVKAEILGGGYNISMTDTLDFGNFYTCDLVDTTLYLDINLTNKETTDDIKVTTELENDNFELLKNIDKIDNSVRIPINFSKNIAGVYNSKIKFTFQPCNKVQELYLKAIIKDQKVTIIDPITFDTYEQGNSSTKQISIKNDNQENLIIDNIKLPPDVTFTNPLNLPIILQKDSILLIDITLSTLKVGVYKDSIEINTNKPCEEKYQIKLNGLVTPTALPAGNFIALFGINNQIVAPKNEITIPINIKEDVYKFEEVDINSLTLSLQYPFQALLLMDIESLQNNLIISKLDNYGNLKLIIEEKNKQLFKLNSNQICNLKFYVLDAQPNNYKLNMTDGEVISIPNMTIETEDSSFVEVTKNCVNTTDYTFTKPVSITYSLDQSNLKISLIQPTDDRYILILYDATGRVVDEILDGNQSRGDYFKRINISKLSSGIYFLVLNYPNNVIIKQISIIK